MTPSLLAALELHWSAWAAPFTARYAVETTTSALVGASCGLLGCFVVLRRMALIGDALSHAILPGVVVAFLLFNTDSVVLLSLGALAAGLLAAVSINLVTQLSRTKEDSAIGIVFTALFALGIVIYSAMPRRTHFDLKCYLLGDPLASGTADLALMAGVATVAGLTVVLLYHRLKLVCFDPVVAAAMGVSAAALHYLLMGLLSATIVAGLKSTGVILVVAMLITPASAAYQLTDRFGRMLVLATAFGVLSGLGGMSVAFVANAPAGPAMVVVATGIFLLAMLLGPGHGVVFDRLRRWRLARHIAEEDALKAAFHLDRSGAAVTAAAVEQATTQTAARAQRSLQRLAQEAMVAPSGGGWALTDAGRRRATDLVRSHRLWEVYLAGEAQMAAGQVHAEAERLEHAHELADEVDAELGHPDTDPHGEPIPPKG